MRSSLRHHILAAPVAPAGSLVNLASEWIDIGPPGSGRRASIKRILDAVGMSLTGFAAVTELPVPSAIDELCAGRLDVVALVSGHPVPNVNCAIADCGARLVPMLSPAARQSIDRVDRPLSGGLHHRRVLPGSGCNRADLCGVRRDRNAPRGIDPEGACPRQDPFTSRRRACALGGRALRTGPVPNPGRKLACRRAGSPASGSRRSALTGPLGPLRTARSFHSSARSL